MFAVADKIHYQLEKNRNVDVSKGITEIVEKSKEHQKSWKWLNKEI